MEFFVSCVPPRTTHHSKKVVNIRLRDGRSFAKLADTEQLSTARSIWLSLLKPFQPPEPVAAPVLLDLEFTWPWRGGDSEKVRARGRIPCTVKPDCSNIAKTVEDILCLLGFIENDARVTELRVRKWIGSKVGLRVRVVTVEEGLMEGKR